MSKISTGEWVAVYCIAGIIDIVQWFLIPLVGADTIADPFIGILFALYFQLRGVSMTRRISRLVSLVGTTALEEFSFSIAPAWIVDVWYIHRSVRQEDAEIRASENSENLRTTTAALNHNGRREPTTQTSSLGGRGTTITVSGSANVDGVRRPSVSISGSTSTNTGTSGYEKRYGNKEESQEDELEAEYA